MHPAIRANRRLLVIALAALLAALLWLSIGLLASVSAAAGRDRPGARAGRGSPAISSIAWGSANGQPVRLYTLTSGRGMTVRISNYGGVVQAIDVPGRGGREADVALGFRSLSDY